MNYDEFFQLVVDTNIYKCFRDGIKTDKIWISAEDFNNFWWDMLTPEKYTLQQCHEYKHGKLFNF